MHVFNFFLMPRKFVECTEWSGRGQRKGMKERMCNNVRKWARTRERNRATREWARKQMGGDVNVGMCNCTRGAIEWKENFILQEARLALL